MRNYFKYILYVAVFAGFTSSFADTGVDFLRAVRGDNPSGVKSMIEQGIDPVSGSPQDLLALTKSEMARWQKAVELAGARLPQ